MSMSNPENSSYSGVVITAIVQFSMDMTIEKYLDTWNALSNNDQELLEWKISDSKLESKLDQGPLITDGQNSCKWTGSLVVLAKTFIMVKISGQNF